MLGTVLLLAWAAHRVDVGEVRNLLAHARPGWLLGVFALLPVQVWLLSRRWAMAARRIGVPLPRGVAFREYALSAFLNQVLPGSVAGDAVRIWRHRASADVRWGPVVRAAVIERAGEKPLQVAFATLGLALWPALLPESPPPPGAGVAIGVLAGGALLALLLVARWRPPGPLRPWLEDAARVLLREGGWWRQGGLSVLLIVTGLLNYGFVARALALHVDAAILCIVPLIFLAQSLPVSIGGWGIREASAITLFPLAGLDAEKAAALSVLMGLSLLGSTALTALAALVAGRPGRGVRPWVGMLGLDALLLLVWSGWKLRLPPLSLEVLALCTLGWLLPGGRWPRRLLLAGWWLAFLYEINVGVGLFLMGQPPLFYDELFLARHLGVLARDLWSPERIVPVGVGLLLLALLAVAVRRLAALASEPLDRAGRRLLAGVWAVALASALGVPGVSDLVHVRSSLARAARNASRSVEVWRSVQGRVRASPYRAFDRLELDDPPDVMVFVVESYGRILASHPDLEPNWSARLARMEQSLGQAGWSMASAWSTAPVSGGRSWLADGSALMGMRIAHESVYRHLIDHVDELPTLVGTLARLGYETVKVAPTDRRRPGVELVNELGFGRYLTFEDMGYTGPPVGWGRIPDQYSLHRAHELAFAPADRPLFAFFHLVSSHAPWELVPPILADWRGFDALPPPEGNPVSIQDMAAADEVLKRLRRYRREKVTRARYMGRVGGLTLQAYGATIDYELELLDRYLAAHPRRALVFILGDHQPPVIHRHARGMDTPIHVLAPDPAWLEPLLDRGFVPGMRPPPGGPAAFVHQALYPEVVRLLHHCCGEGPPPPAFPEGLAW